MLIDFSSTLNPYSAKISYIAPGDASLKIDNPDVNFTGGIRVDGTMASKSIISTPKDIKAGGFIKAGGDITAGGNIFATGTINAVGGLATSDNLQIGGLITSSLGTATMKIQGTGVNISDELRVGGHLKAASIGKMDTSVGNSVTVVPKGSGHTTKYCESKSYQMLSCSPIYYGTQSGLPGIYFPMPKPDIYNGKAHIGNSFIDRYTDPDGIQFCDTTVYNQYASPIDFGIQTTCFDPNQ